MTALTVPGTLGVPFWMVLWSSHHMSILRASPDLRRVSAQGLRPNPSCGTPVSTTPMAPKLHRTDRGSL